MNPKVQRGPVPKEDQPSTEVQAAAKPLDGAILVPLDPRKGKDVAQARLVALIEKQLGGPVRCGACQRPLHAFRSVLAGIGPVCRSKRAGRPGMVA